VSGGGRTWQPRAAARRMGRTGLLACRISVGEDEENTGAGRAVASSHPPNASFGTHDAE